MAIDHIARLVFLIVATCSIFIPAYNAAKTLSQVIERIPDELWDKLVAVIVINDGSEDATETVVEVLLERYPKLRLVSHRPNRGYGTTVCEGLHQCIKAGGEYIVCLHADGQYPPEKIAAFTTYMAEHGVDVLQGSRHKDGTALAGGMPRYKWLAGRVLTWLENKTFRLQLTDYHSGFLLYSRHAAESLPFDELSKYFDFDLEVIASARARGFVIDELGIPTRYADEESYLSPIMYGFRCLRVMLRYRLGRYHP